MVTQMFQTNNQPAVFNHVVVMPGIPIQQVINMIGMLLGAYGVTHQLPINVVDGDSISTGCDNMDITYGARYLELKNFISDLVREYKLVSCSAMGMGPGLQLTFTCY